MNNTEGIKVSFEQCGKFEDIVSQVLQFSELFEHLARIDGRIPMFLLQERAHFAPSVDMLTTQSKEVLDRFREVKVLHGTHYGVTHFA